MRRQSLTVTAAIIAGQHSRIEGSMKKSAKITSLSASEAKAMLARYACPYPYHQVRARFMGNIATPDMTVSPMQEIQRLWNNELPVFDSNADAEAFFGMFFQGLWNALSGHQKRTDPFKLAKIATGVANLRYHLRNFGQG